MIESFPLDYMHLLLIGVTKKLLITWLHGNLKVRMQSRIQNEISRYLLEIQSTQSRIFSRKCRALDDLSYWKSTEYRTFILYTGPVVLKNSLSPELYENFLQLHVSTKLCVSSQCQKHLETAQIGFEHFLNSFESCYGQSLISSNVHGVIHLVDCVRKYGPLDNFSAFEFENTLGKIKKFITKNKQELQQAAKRIEEFNGLLSKVEKHSIKPIISLENPKGSGFYTLLHYNNLKYRNDDRDRWFLTNDKKIVKIVYFKKVNFKGISSIAIFGKEVLGPYEDIYKLPINSMKLNMFKVKQQKYSAMKIFSVKDINLKVFFFKIQNESFFMGI